MPSTFRILVLALTCAGLAACAKQVKDPPPATVTTTTTTPGSGAVTTPMPPAPPTRQGAYTEADLDRDACLLQRTVYFDLDQDVVKPDFQAVLACHARYLRDRPTARMTLQGHTDERGSREYNMALGERRARAVAAVMQANGAAAGQLDVVSFGEENPVCGEADETCWARNRRAEFLYNQR